MILSDQDDPLVLSSVLDRPNLSQCLHRPRCVTQYVCLQNPPRAHIQYSPATSACKAIWEACMSVPSMCAPVPLHCHVSCLQTIRLSCSHTGTCGFKCDPDLYEGQGVKEGEEEEEEGERRDEGRRECEEKRESISSQYPT